MPKQKPTRLEAEIQRRKQDRVAPVRSLKAPPVIKTETFSKLDFEVSLFWGAIRFPCHKAPVLTQQVGEEQ